MSRSSFDFLRFPVTTFWKLNPFYQHLILKSVLVFPANSLKEPAVSSFKETFFRCVFASGWNALKYTVVLSSCEGTSAFWGSFYDPIQRLTSQTQEGRNPEGLYSIKRSVWASFLLFKPAWTPTLNSFSGLRCRYCVLRHWIFVCLSTSVNAFIMRNNKSD